MTGPRTTLPEPKPRKDGRCVVCNKPITTKSRYTEQDAFCSAAHCKEYFGAQELSGPPHPDNQSPQED
jgi:hypothetical protein